MNLYNTLTKKEEKFIPVDNNEVKIYTLNSTEGVQSITANECFSRYLYLNPY